MVWCMQLRCQRLTLAPFGCQSITYICSQRRSIDIRRQRGQPITERVMRLWLTSYRILWAGVQPTLDPYAEAFL